MKGPLYKEQHEVTKFEIFTEPVEYKMLGYRRTKTILSKSDNTLEAN